MRNRWFWVLAMLLLGFSNLEAQPAPVDSTRVNVRCFNSATFTNKCLIFEVHSLRFGTERFEADNFGNLVLPSRYQRLGPPEIVHDTVEVADAAAVNAAVKAAVDSVVRVTAARAGSGAAALTATTVSRRPTTTQTCNLGTPYAVRPGRQPLPGEVRMVTDKPYFVRINQRVARPGVPGFTDIIWHDCELPAGTPYWASSGGAWVEICGNDALGLPLSPGAEPAPVPQGQPVQLLPGRIPLDITLTVGGKVDLVASGAVANTGGGSVTGPTLPSPRAWYQPLWWKAPVGVAAVAGAACGVAAVFFDKWCIVMRQVNK